MNTTANPLTQFYRVERLSVRLPSRGQYYDNDVVNLNDDGEVPIFPMTAADEMQLKNPDALLSGSAIIDVLRSCVPAIKQPTKLLSCDIDVLMIGIRHASYGGGADMTLVCPSPSCGADNIYRVDLDTMLNTAEVLDDSYEAVLQDGKLTVYIKPGTFSAILKRQKTAFEGAQLGRAVSNVDLSDEQRLKLFASTYTKLTKLNFELISDAIDRIVFSDEAGELTEVKNKKHIDDFIKNVAKEDVDKIEEVIKAVNKIGIAQFMPAVCTTCQHKWEAPIEFNPVNFS